MSCWASARSPATLTDVLTSRLANWSGLHQACQNAVCWSWFMPSVYYKTYLLAVSIALPQSLSLSLPQWLRPLFWCCDSVNQTLLWSAVESRRASINPRFTRERALIMDWLCFSQVEKEWSLFLTEIHCSPSLVRLVWFITYAVCSSAQAYLSNAALQEKVPQDFVNYYQSRVAVHFWWCCSAQKEVRLYGKEQKYGHDLLRVVLWTCTIYCEIF